MPDALPVGDWTAASVRIRAALPQPFSKIITQEHMNKIPGFERMLIYLSPSMIQQTKMILKYVIDWNQQFCRTQGSDLTKQMFKTNLEPEDAIGLLQTNTILSALQNSTK